MRGAASHVDVGRGSAVAGGNHVQHSRSKKHPMAVITHPLVIFRALGRLPTVERESNPFSLVTVKERGWGKGQRIG